MEEIIVREISSQRDTEQEEAGWNENDKEKKYQNNGGNSMDKKLTKSQSDRMLCGVCAGLAEYFNVDPTVIRLLWVILTFCGGSGILAYIIAAVIIPEA